MKVFSGWISSHDFDVLIKGSCPNCGGRNFKGGPRGGMSRNILCANCKTEFNVGPAGAEHNGTCPPEREAQFFTETLEAK